MEDYLVRNPQVIERALRQRRPLLQGDLRDEEPHPLFDVTAEHLSRAGRNPVAVPPQPGFESTALLSREDDDVVLADRIGRLDGHAERRIAGAALDVFETNPVAPDSPLLALDNVVLSPHLGGATQETIERHSRMMADDILRFLGGERPVNLVNPDAWDHRAE